MYHGTGKMQFQVFRRVDLNKQQFRQRIYLFTRRIAKHCRKITLRVIVDQQDLFVFVCKSSSKIQCCCSLTNTTLRVGDRYYSVFPHIYYS